MNEILGIVVTVLAVIGVVLNNRKMSICFIFWLVSNSLSSLIHLNCGVYSLALRDIIFFVLAIEGLLKWRK